MWERPGVLCPHIRLAVRSRSCAPVRPAQGLPRPPARLAARLTGFKIDIKSETQAREAGDFLDYEEEYDEDEYFDEEEYYEETAAEDEAEATEG